MPAGVTLFTACNPACDSRDPLLNQAGSGVGRAESREGVLSATSESRAPQRFATASVADEDIGMVDRTFDTGKNLLAATYERTVTGLDATLGRLSPF